MMGVVFSQIIMAELFGFIAAGKLSIRVGKVLPLSRVAEAHRLLECHQTTGKVVLQSWVGACPG